MIRIYNSTIFERGTYTSLTLQEHRVMDFVIWLVLHVQETMITTLPGTQVQATMEVCTGTVELPISVSVLFPIYFISLDVASLII